MTTAIKPYSTRVRTGRDGFAQLLRAEWTKFRTVRGWVLAMVAAVLVTVLIGLLGAEGSHSSGGPRVIPAGPGGEAVNDTFYFVHQPLTGDGGITARLSSLTGVSIHPQGPGAPPVTQSGTEPWTKAGIIIKESTKQGSTYAAMMVTGSHGVRMQYDFVHDTAGSPVSGGASWLRLTRSGDTLTGYQSVDGVTWTRVGSAHLPGLTTTVQVGLFAASPHHVQGSTRFGGASTITGGPTQATAAFDHVSLQGGASGDAWKGETTGGDQGDPMVPPGGFHRSGGGFTVQGTGDIAPIADHGDGMPIEETLSGLFGGLIVVVVVASMFVTAEYRRGMIRTTFTASPRRGRVLVAKAVVIGTVTFVAGLVAAAVAVPLNVHVLRNNGNLINPVPTLTEMRIVVGSAALLAVAAVLALALGAVLRHGAGAITTVIAMIVLPYIISTAAVLPVGPTDWVLRLTPAAAFAVQQSTPQYAQVDGFYTPWHGYYPLAPWAGFAVLCAYAALALGLAAYLLRKRDA